MIARRTAGRRISASILAAGLLLAGCGSTTPGNASAASGPATAAVTSSPAGTANETQPRASTTVAPRGGVIDPATVDENNPNAIAVAAVITLYRWDSRTDLSPLDATQRAAAWFTPDLASDSTTGPARGNAAWVELVDHDGYTTVTAVPANEYGQPPNTDTRALTQVSYTVTSIGADGWTTTSDPTVLRVRLARTSISEPWRVSGFAV
ncbi:hypothetical protein [Micromonospora sp.]|uniref:hypothetical protein n=1 Tax=Micromonospora sp. TaxID=1876 RepID=UPI003B3AB0AE